MSLVEQEQEEWPPAFGVVPEWSGKFVEQVDGCVAQIAVHDEDPHGWTVPPGWRLDAIERLDAWQADVYTYVRCDA